MKSIGSLHRNAVTASALCVVVLSGLGFSAIPPNYSAVPFRNVIQQIPGRFFVWRYDSAEARGVSWENPGTDVMTGDYYQYDGRTTAGVEDRIMNRVLNPAWDVYGTSDLHHPANPADTNANPPSDTTLIYNDMNAVKDGIYIGYIDHGEWVKSTVNVASDGVYRIDLMLTSITSSPSISIAALDGTDSVSTGTITFENTGFYHYYQLEKNAATIRLKKGLQVIRTEVTGAGPFNLWFFRFSLVGSTGAGPMSGPASKAPRTRWGEAGATILHDGSVQVSFSAQSDNPVTVTMFNAMGREYGSEIFASVKCGINTLRCRTRPAPGVAFIRLKQGDAVIVKKVAAAGGKR